MSASIKIMLTCDVCHLTMVNRTVGSIGAAKEVMDTYLTDVGWVTDGFNIICDECVKKVNTELKDGE